MRVLKPFTTEDTEDTEVTEVFRSPFEALGKEQVWKGDEMKDNALVTRELTWRILQAAFEVHTQLGPGLLESTYRRCLLHELRLSGMEAQTEIAVPMAYKGLEIDCTYRADVIVEGKVMLELKAVAAILPIHKAQLLTYLKLTKIKLGYLLSFHSIHLRDGLCRLIA